MTHDKFSNPAKFSILCVLSLSAIYIFAHYLSNPIMESIYNGTFPVPGSHRIAEKLFRHPFSYYESILNAFIAMFPLGISGVALFALHMAFLHVKGTKFIGNVRRRTLGYERFWVALYALWGLFVAFKLIVASGDTYLTIMTHDTFIFIDGIYRLNSGQIPNLDFHSPLGASAYAIPYWAFLFRGTYSGSLELASFGVSAVLAIILTILLVGRCRIFVSICIILLALLFVNVPLVPTGIGPTGGIGVEISHAMFYNRWGWVALFAIFVTYIPLTYCSNARLLAESSITGVLLVFLFFLKLSYFIPALILMVILAFRSRNDRVFAALSILAGIILWAFIEIKLGISLSYIRDIVIAAQASESIIPRIQGSTSFSIVSLNLVIATSACYLILSSGLTRRIDFVFCAFALICGIVIKSQNADGNSIFLYFIIFIFGMFILSRSNNIGNISSGASVFRMQAERFMFLLFVIFATPIVFQYAIGVVKITAGLATRENYSTIDGIPGIYINEKLFLIDRLVDGSNIRDVFNEIREENPRQPLSQSEYAATINDGSALLRKSQADGPILTMDMIGPFNIILKEKPPRGDCSWYHSLRSFSRKYHEPAEDVLRDIKYVMDPVFPMVLPTRNALWDIYGQYINDRFEIMSKSKYWILYVRR